MERKLPIVHENNKKGNISVALLESVLSRFSIVNSVPVEKDIGIDLHVELLNDSIPNGLYFNVQCKGKEEIEINQDKIKIPIKIATINYWLLRKEPTFLFVVDSINLDFFWCYPYEQIEEKLNELQKQNTVIINVDKKSVFPSGIRELPGEMERIILNFDYKLFENLSESISEMALENVVNQPGTFKEKLMAFKDSTDLLKENFNIIIERKRDQYILDQTKVILGKFQYVFIWLDAESPYIYRYTHGKSIQEADGFIENSTIGDFIESVISKIDNYERRTTEENFNTLITSLEKLNDLNKDLVYFLREILYEINPYGDYEFLVEEY